jgi:hypothetical protein
MINSPKIIYFGEFISCQPIRYRDHSIDLFQSYYYISLFLSRFDITVSFNDLF